MSELKRCPFCGGEAELITTYDTEMVRCKKCFGKTQTFTGDYYDEGQMCGMYAIPAWNTRIPMQNIVERLEECYERYEDLEYYEHLENGHSLDFEYCHGKKDGVNEAIEIVKEEGGMNEIM